MGKTDEAISFESKRFKIDVSLQMQDSNPHEEVNFAAVNLAGAKVLLPSGTTLLRTFLLSAGAVALYSMAATVVVIAIVKLLGPIRVDESAEQEGLDLSQHGEAIN